jgi:glutamine amidotransferase
MRTRVVIVDNGGANVASLRFALERLECRAELSSDARTIAAASHVLLPGVGAAGDAMQRLRAHHLDEVIPKLSQPVLGICLGMQLLYESSEENDARCLGAIPGVARRIAPAPGRPVPHMGWNQLQPTRASPLVAGVQPGEYAYFVHSFAVALGDETLARTDYGDAFSAIVARRNFFGTQFHPERSGHTGATILRNFLALD